jgi:hypothetical protein
MILIKDESELPFPQDGDVVQSIKTENYFIINFDKKTRTWFKTPVGGFSTPNAKINYYNSVNDLIKKELCFDYKVIKNNSKRKI